MALVALERLSALLSARKTFASTAYRTVVVLKEVWG
jgi:hypothetical protein